MPTARFDCGRADFQLSDASHRLQHKPGLVAALPLVER